MLAGNYLNTLISTNSVEQAIGVLQKLSDHLPKNTALQVDLLSSRYFELKGKDEQGILANDERDLQSARIKHSLLEIVRQLPADLEWEISGTDSVRLSIRQTLIKYRRHVLVGTLLYFAGMAIFVTQSAKSGVDCRLEIESTSLRFVNNEKTVLNTDGSYKYAGINDFARMEIPATHVAVHDELTGINAEHAVSAPMLQITPIPGDQTSISLAPIKLQNLELSDSLRVVIEIPAKLGQGEHVVRMHFNPGLIKGTLVMYDSVSMECNGCLLHHLGEARTSEYTFLESTLYGASEGQTLRFSGGADLLALNIKPANETGKVLDQRKALPVHALELKRPDLQTGPPISSLLRANLTYLDRKGEAYLQSEIEEGAFLVLDESDVLNITNMHIEHDKIAFVITGNVRQILAGATDDSLQSKNPDFWSWMLHCQPLATYLLIGIPILLAAFPYVLLKI